MNRTVYIIAVLFFLFVSQTNAQTALPFGWDRMVVIIEKFTPNKFGGVDTITHGTGFFVVDESRFFGTILVSNRHVLANRDSILLKLFTGSGFAYNVVRLKDKSGKPLWKGHPNASVDVAAIPVPLDTGMGAAEYSRFRELVNIDVGEDVFFFGFPLMIESESQNLGGPILRHGITSYKTVEVTAIGDDFIPPNVILIDGFSFGGNSGSPVMTRSNLLIGPGTFTRSDSLRAKSNLIGIVYGHIPNYEAVVDSDTSVIKDTVGFVRMNTGLVKAFPAERIRETVEQFRPKGKR